MSPYDDIWLYFSADSGTNDSQYVSYHWFPYYIDLSHYRLDARRFTLAEVEP